MMDGPDTAFHPDEEGCKLETMAGTRAKPRFSYTEVKLLLEAVKRNRYILLRRFNRGVSADAKKHTWNEITEQINSLGENHREVRQIMKKWADLKCDGKRRIVAMRGPNGRNLRKKNLGPIEKMVHKILMMSPKGDGESDVDLDEEHLSNLSSSSYSSINVPDTSYTETVSAEPDVDDYELDIEDEDDEEQHSPLESDEFLKFKPTHTYSRQGHSSSTSQALSPPAPHTAAVLGQSGAPFDSSSPVPLSLHLSRSVQQQRTARLLLASVARSVETLARSLQLLMERQQEFVQESLQLQRQSVEILRDFSHTALTMLRAQPHQGPGKPMHMYK